MKVMLRKSPNTFRNKAIVFNCSYNGLSIIQELASNGISCIALDSIRGIGTFSKFTKYVKCPDPLYQESEFIDFLWGLCSSQTEKPVLIPTNDEWAMSISKHKERLSEVAYVCAADFFTMELIINKDKFYDYCGKMKYSVPKTWNWEFWSTIEDFPVIAKPKYRAISGEDKNNRSTKNLAKSSLRMVKIYDKNGLEEFVNTYSYLSELYIFQDLIEGDSHQMFTIGIYANRSSEIKGVFTGRKVRGYPAEYGDCIVGENHSVPKFVLEEVFRLTSELKFTGIAEFEYKQDIVSGEFYLIEINPRAWSWIGITPSCGVNLPLIAYNDQIGLPTGEVVSSEDMPNGRVKYVKIMQDFLNCLIKYRRNYPKWAKSLSQWRSSLNAETVIKAEFHNHDWPIYFYSVIYALAKFFRA